MFMVSAVMTFVNVKEVAPICVSVTPFKVIFHMPLPTSLQGTVTVMAEYEYVVSAFTEVPSYRFPVSTGVPITGLTVSMFGVARLATLALPALSYAVAVYSILPLPAGMLYVCVYVNPFMVPDAADAFEPALPAGTTVTLLSPLPPLSVARMYKVTAFCVHPGSQYMLFMTGTTLSIFDTVTLVSEPFFPTWSSKLPPYVPLLLTDTERDTLPVVPTAYVAVLPASVKLFMPDCVSLTVAESVTFWFVHAVVLREI
jgi:hypothetical protein